MAKVWAWNCLLALAMLVSESRAQDSSCLNQLVPCLEYINSNKNPPSSCCDPLKSLIKSDPQCLCSMLGSKSLSRQAGINVTQAQGLPSKCGEKVGAASCTSSPRTKAGIPNSASNSSLVNAMLVAALLIIIQISSASICMLA